MEDDTSRLDCMVQLRERCGVGDVEANDLGADFAQTPDSD
jgi:hypothetical protein